MFSGRYSSVRADASRHDATAGHCDAAGLIRPTGLVLMFSTGNTDLMDDVWPVNKTPFRIAFCPQ